MIQAPPRRMKLPDFDDSEFIPLPEDPKAPANPMS